MNSQRLLIPPTRRLLAVIAIASALAAPLAHAQDDPELPTDRRIERAAPRDSERRIGGDHSGDDEDATPADRRTGTKGIRVLRPGRGPAALTEDELAATAEAIRPAVVPVRAVERQHALARAGAIPIQGAAVLLRFAEGEDPVFVSSWAWLARASDIEVWDGHRWRRATPAHASTMFDLVALEVRDFIDAETRARPLARDWELDPLVVGLGPVTPNSGGELLLGSMGPKPVGDFVYYQRSLLALHHGYPLFDRAHNVVAITSVPALDGEGGIFAIAFPFVAEWRREWPRLSRDTIGWSPEVREEKIEVRSGADVLRPR